MNKIKAISISDRKGMRKKNIESTRLIANFGLEDDAHAGKWHRQVSFLAEESIETMRDKGLDVVAGNFAENITTEGLDLPSLKVGTHLKIGESELVISQLGKICHDRCAIYHQAGDCVMPREGIFGVVLQGGSIRVGDKIVLQDKISDAAAIIGSKETEEKLGDELKRLVIEKCQPVFIRFDTISDKEGGSLTAILEDLTTTQEIKNILIFDPSGNLGLTLAGLSSQQDQPNHFEINGSTIDYCRTTDEVEKL
ncbi:MAG: MOSC domain-containing protein [Desulfobacterales bacterium]|nr:MOSC domain-containing protein [Desulfobacterales bacterium]